jgi:2-polyprenyl-3-methyl-5-hydroxy-6-metoxy-1,4-benzoquinol methylase
MDRIETPESLHEQDWQEKKPDDSKLEDTCRFDTLIRLIRKHDPSIVFDIGCGSGVLGRKIKAWKSEVVLHGCDISETALKRARACFEKAWKTDLDCEDIPAESGRYDVVVCSEVFEHIYDVNHLLREVNRLLKPVGVGLLTVPNVCYWRYRLDILVGKLPIPMNDDRHIHQFTREHFGKKLHNASLTTQTVRGGRIRLPWLATWKPTVFSDTLVFEVKKTSP